MTTILNFAYGSNMLLARLQARTPSARPLGVAVLPGHQLRWHKLGRDGSGKCDILSTGCDSDEVHGVLYAMASTDKPLLDAAEGLGHGYDEKPVHLLHAGRRVTAWAYWATRVDPGLRPYHWYRALVLAGAVQHALPQPYVAQIASAPAVHDSDVQRHALHMALARGQPL